MEIEIFVDAVQHEPVGAGRKMRRLTPAEVHQRAKSFRANWLARELGDPSQEPHDAFAPLAVLPGRYPRFSVGVLVVFVEPDDIAGAPVEVSRLGKGIVEIDITPEGHNEQRSVDGHEPRPSSQNA